MEVHAEHRQNLHDLILGATGVALAQRVDQLAAQIRTHNTELREKSNAIPLAERHGLSVDDFCALTAVPAIDQAITEAEQRLAALKNANNVRSAQQFTSLSLPELDVASISSLLAASIGSLDREAAEMVRVQLNSLGEGAEEWIAKGMGFAVPPGASRERDDCPFCKRPLTTSEVFDYYRSYFGQAYALLQNRIATQKELIELVLSGDALAGFQRQVEAAQRLRQFWSQFAVIPEVNIDTTAVADDWQQVRGKILAAITSKQADPLSESALTQDTLDAIRDYELRATLVKAISGALLAANAVILSTKESVAAGNTATADAELTRLRATKARHEPANVTLCPGLPD